MLPVRETQGCFDVVMTISEYAALSQTYGMVLNMGFCIKGARGLHQGGRFRTKGGMSSTKGRKICHLVFMLAGAVK